MWGLSFFGSVAIHITRESATAIASIFPHSSRPLWPVSLQAFFVLQGRNGAPVRPAVFLRELDADLRK